MKRLITASLLLAFFVPGTGVSEPVQVASVGHARVCARTFTVRMARRAGDAVEGHSRAPSRRERRMLARIKRCQRNPRARWYVAWLYRRARVRRAQRIQAARDAQLPQATASWYDDSSGACASPAGCSSYGIAHKTLAFGTRVLICFPAGSSHCVETTVDDRGPFVAGRTFDLDQRVAGALGFSGVQAVSYRVG